MKMVAAISADVAVANKQLAVGQTGSQIKRVDVGHASGADDAIDPDDRLLAGDGVVAAAKNGDFRPRLPAHFARCVVHDSLFERNPRLGKPLRR